MAVQTVAPHLLQLIADLTRLTGESPETAIEIAVRERLDKLETPEARDLRWAEAQALVDELSTIVRQHPEINIDHGELLYGEDCLPR